MVHKFEPGQMVRFAGGRNAADGFYEIIQVLPSRDGELQYRIKSEREPHQRVVNESDLDRS